MSERQTRKKRTKCHVWRMAKISDPSNSATSTEVKANGRAKIYGLPNRETKLNMPRQERCFLCFVSRLGRVGWWAPLLRSSFRHLRYFKAFRDRNSWTDLQLQERTTAPGQARRRVKNSWRPLMTLTSSQTSRAFVSWWKKIRRKTVKNKQTAELNVPNKRVT